MPANRRDFRARKSDRNEKTSSLLPSDTHVLVVERNKSEIIQVNSLLEIKIYRGDSNPKRGGEDPVKSQNAQNPGVPALYGWLLP